jgi:hypothetical protein
MSGSDRSLGVLPLEIPLTEPERRRVEFAGGVPIIMPNGVSWRAYEPEPVVRPSRNDDGEDGFVIAWNFGDRLDDETNESLSQGWQKILNKIARATNDADRACGFLEAAWLLLARNYVLSQEEFEDLLLPLASAKERRAKTKRLCGTISRLVAEACAKVSILAAIKVAETQHVDG